MKEYQAANIIVPAFSRIQPMFRWSTIHVPYFDAQWRPREFQMQMMPRGPFLCFEWRSGSQSGILALTEDDFL